VWRSQGSAGIRSPDDFRDERNPYWFLPPPTHRCVYKWRKCTLDACSKENLQQQRVGTFGTTTWFKTGNTQVYNCQPLLQVDMTAKQKQILDEKTAPLREEYNTLERNVARLQYRLEEMCPWITPIRDSMLRCNDGTACPLYLNKRRWVPYRYADEGKGRKQTCCDDHRGTKKCPENFPFMCSDDSCSHDSACSDGGGLKVCHAALNCQWLLPTVKNGLLMCEDGTFKHRGIFQAKCCTRGDCGKHGGTARCPYDKPVMCANKFDNDWACRTSGAQCEKLGGPRKCDRLMGPDPADMPTTNLDGSDIPKRNGLRVHDDNDIPSGAEYSGHMRKSWSIF